MKCAIYARKSNDDNDKNEEYKSVARQIEHARAYIEKKGWQVLPDHIYMDDAISGAEYVNRPGMHRLLNNLKSFDAIVMSESSRFGRDMARNTSYIINIVENGVRIFYYLTDEEEKAETPEQRLMITVKSYASEVERQKASQRSRDALLQRARKGYNTGGIVYGYDNIQVSTGQKDENGIDIKSHTDYRINPEQAEVIKAIFRAYADGHGYAVIAKAMNKDDKYSELTEKYFNNLNLETPRKGTGSWAPTAIREILRRERYRGIIQFGEYRTAYKGGTQVRVKQKEYLKTERPDLKIIDDELWAAVQKRLKTVNEVYTQVCDKPKSDTGRVSKYLLSGLGQCGCCGGSIVAQSGAHGSGKKRQKVVTYACSYRINRGSTVCPNKLMQRIDIVDEQLLSMLEARILTPVCLAHIYRKALEDIRDKIKENLKKDESGLKVLQKERDKIKKELRNFESVIASGKSNDYLIECMDKRLQKLKEVEAKIIELEVAPKILQLNLDNIEKEIPDLVRQKVEDIRGLLRRNVESARNALRELLSGRIIFTPIEVNGRLTYRIQAVLKTGELLDNIKENGKNDNTGVPTGILMLERLFMPFEFVLRAA